MAARSAPASASAPASRPAKAPASPGGTSQPVATFSATAGSASTVSGGAPMAVAITGQPMAAASMAARPKASGSVEATTVTCAARKAAATSSTWPTKRTWSLEARLCDLGSQRLDVGGAALGVAGQHHHGALQLAGCLQLRGGLDQHALALPAREPRHLQDDAGGIVHPPARAQGGDAARARSQAGSNRRVSTPRWITAMRWREVP